MKVGIFGGSFNPIHNGHVEIMNYLLDNKILDEVWVVPCGSHAFGKNLESGEHRCRMIELATDGNRKMKINRIELDSKKESRTIETLRKLRRDFPHEFFLVIGTDILQEIDKWYKSKELIQEADFLVFQRKGYPIKRRRKNITVIESTPTGISSTEIRKRISKGKSIRNLVPEKVQDYILKKGIYQ